MCSVFLRKLCLGTFSVSLQLRSLESLAVLETSKNEIPEAKVSTVYEVSNENYYSLRDVFVKPKPSSRLSHFILMLDSYKQQSCVNMLNHHDITGKGPTCS